MQLFSAQTQPQMLSLIGLWQRQRPKDRCRASLRLLGILLAVSYALSQQLPLATNLGEDYLYTVIAELIVMVMFFCYSLRLTGAVILVNTALQWGAISYVYPHLPLYITLPLALLAVLCIMWFVRDYSLGKL